MMTMMTMILLFILAILIFSISIVYKRKFSKAPPHVRGLPLLGYVPFLGKVPFKTLHKLTEKNGSVFSFYMGSIYTVVLGTYDSLYEAFVKKSSNFSYRPSNLAMKVYDHETAFVYLDGDEWKLIRNFSMNSLKSFGFGKKIMNSRLQYEIECYVEEIKKHLDTPFNVDEVLARSICNSILSLITGDHQLPESWVKNLTVMVTHLAHSYTYDLGTLYPWMKKIFFLKKFTERKMIKDLKDKYWNLWEDEIGKDKEYFSKNCLETKSLIQHWFMEQIKRNESNDPYKDLFSDFSLKNNVDILLQASVHTTTVTVLWAYLYLLLYPEMQTKIQQEIDQYIGEDRQPIIEDLQNMEFTKAFIMEVNRKSSVLPLGIFHRNKEPDVIQGYQIKESSLIISNIWGIHHDPKYFKEPFKFKPERFLDENGKQIPCSQIVTFSTGGRICPGKSIAESQIFLSIVAILQKFELKTPPHLKLTDIATVENAFIRKPESFEMIFTYRHM